MCLSACLFVCTSAGRDEVGEGKKFSLWCLEFAFQFINLYETLEPIGSSPAYEVTEPSPNNELIGAVTFCGQKSHPKKYGSRSLRGFV